MMFSTYCMKCKKPVNTAEGRVETVDNPKGVRYAIRGVCPECGTNQFKFTSEETYHEWQKQ